MPEQAPLLAFEAVTGARGGRVLFRDLSFVCGPGDAVLVTGPNGAGKSSLLRIAAGLLAPTAGRVRGGGARALMAEADALDRERTLADALGFWARLDGAGSVRVADAMNAVGLAEMARVPVRLLSTGQRRRAALARVAASGAEVWLLDEPANGLDAAAVCGLETLVAAHRAKGGAVVVATHLLVKLPDAHAIRLSPPPPFVSSAVETRAPSAGPRFSTWLERNGGREG